MCFSAVSPDYWHHSPTWLKCRCAQLPRLSTGASSQQLPTKTMSRCVRYSPSSELLSLPCLMRAWQGLARPCPNKHGGSGGLPLGGLSTIQFTPWAKPLYSASPVCRSHTPLVPCQPIDLSAKGPRWQVRTAKPGLRGRVFRVVSLSLSLALFENDSDQAPLQ